MRKLLIACAALALGGAAQAEMWKDYTPGKGTWQVTAMKVDPNHIDDYLLGLKMTWVPGAEISKKKGLIDDYKILVSDGVGDQANVLLMQHVTSFANLEPNQARDQQLEKEIYAATPKARMEAKVGDYEKYREFVSGGNFSEITFK